MATKAGTNDPYPASPDTILDMLADPDYVNAKYVELKDRKFEVLQLDRTGKGLTLKVDRQVEANLPDMAKKVLGETNHLVQTEVWTSSGSGYDCDVTIASPGKPMTITGKMKITPTGADTSQWKVDFDIKASVPLIGGKLEKIVADETASNLAKEYAFNKAWLASH